MGKRCAEDDPNVRAKRFKCSYTDVTKVRVGKNGKETTFLVHRDPICANSKFFKAACSEKWPRSEEDEPIDLSEHDPENFKVYLGYIYGKRDLLGLIIDVAQARADRIRSICPNIDWYWHQGRAYRLVIISELWTLGDYLRDTGFLNTIITRLDRGARTGTGLLYWNGVNRVFRENPEGCNLQRWILDYGAMHMIHYREGRFERCNKTVKLALMRAIIAKDYHEGYAQTWDVCEFHDHGEDDEEGQ